MAVWNPRANEIFASVLELPPAQRQAHLDQVCGAEIELRREVEALLAAHAQAGSFLDRPAPGAVQPGAQDNLQPAETLPPALPDNPADMPTLAPREGSVDPLLGTVRYVGDYELLAELGRGGMGVVYKARQVSLKRLVALKMILAGGHAGAAELARFRTEGEAIARLQHPNIVQVYEVGEHEGKPFFSLEFCPGGSLERKLDGTPLPPKAAAQLIETLARAIDVAHQAHVIHRDLKPANVLLTVDGTLKITDFGLAKKLDDVAQTASGAIMGTPSYMAPEQAGGKSKELGPACDTYALGTILYELLTGHPPFKAATPLDTLVQVVADEPVAPTQLQKRTPRDLETICLKCLQKEPARRYATALALADDLGRFQRGEPIAARPVGPLERIWRWCQRNSAVAALVAVVAFTLLLGTVVATVFAVRAAEQAQRADDNAWQAKEAQKEAELQAEQARAEAEARKKEAAARALSEQLARQERGRADRRAYLSDLRLAQRFWEDGQLDLAHDVLGTMKPDAPDAEDLRGFEWGYLWRQTQLEAEKYQGLLLSPDGHTLVRFSGKGMERVDARTGLNVHALQEGPDVVTAVHFSPNGRWLAAACPGEGQPKVKMWDAQGGQLLATVPFRVAGFSGLAFTSDSRSLVLGGQEGMGVVDLGTGKMVSPAPPTPVPVVVAGVVGCGLPAPVLAAHLILSGIPASPQRTLADIAATAGPVTSLSLSANGSYLAMVSGPGQAQKLEVWDLRARRLRCSLIPRKDRHVEALAISPDGTLLAGACPDTLSRTKRGPDGNKLAPAFPANIHLWDTTDGREKAVLSGHTDSIVSLEFGPAGEYLVSGGGDRTARVWQPRQGRLLEVLKGHAGPVFLLSPRAGTDFLTSSDGQWVKVWKLGRDRPLDIPEPQADVFAISPDARRLAIAVGGDGFPGELPEEAGNNQPGEKGNVPGKAREPGRPLRVLDLSTGRVVLEGGKVGGRFASLAYSPAGDRIAGVGPGGLMLWDADKGHEQRAIAVRGQLSTVAFSRDGRRLVIGGDLGKVPWLPERLSLYYAAGSWDVGTGEQTGAMMNLGPPHLHDLALSPDGNLIAGVVQRFEGWGGALLMFWQGQSGELLHFEPLPRQRQHTVRWSQKGKWLAVSDGPTVGLWDATTRRRQSTLKGHGGDVAALAFTLDGRRLATASSRNAAGNESEVRLWDLPSCQQLLTLPLAGPCRALGFSNDGHRLVVVGTAKVHIWEATPPKR